MTNLNRRQWLQKSAFTASLLALGCRTNFDIVDTKPFKNGLINTTPLPLHWNENPFGPSKKAVQAVAEVMVDNSQILLTNGSTEILGLVGQQIGFDKGELVIPSPSFPTMAMFAAGSGATIKKVPLAKNNVIDLGQTLAAISDKTKVVFICNPNNPTSTEVDNEDLKAFCRAVPKNVLVFVDEAYIEYSKLGTAGSMVSLVNELPNLMICRTFSKAYGMAGLRLGYAISSKTHIEDVDFMANGIQKNQEGKDIVYQAFDKWGVGYSPSATNFLYVESKHFVADVRDKLKDKNILITKWPDMVDHIRVSISEPSHMSQFVEVVEGFLV